MGTATSDEVTPAKGRLFLVSHNFPPTLGPESSLVRLNTIDLCNRGWQVSVLTTTTEHMHQSQDFGMLQGLPASLEVIRSPSYDAVINKRFHRFGRVLMFMLRSYLLPEVFLLWLFSAMPAGRRWLKQNRDVIIYSRATKHVSNVLGWYLKCATGLPWVAHMSDPWVDHTINPFQRWVAGRLEKLIFRDADAIVTVSARLGEHLLKPYPWARHKMHIIPHGYAPRTQAFQHHAAGTRPLRILHAGCFYPGYREPDKLFEGLALLNQRASLQGRLTTILVGDDTGYFQGSAERLGLSQIVEFLPSVAYAKCQQMIAESDLLLVIDAPGTGGIFLPTKLIEYLAHQKPVLGLAEPDSTIHQLLQECDLSFADQNNPQHIAEVLLGLLDRWESGTWGVSDLSKQRGGRYQIDQVNGALDELFSSVANRGV
jgi:glycosyltransferase involved in cell wall biosynthesis